MARDWSRHNDPISIIHTGGVDAGSILPSDIQLSALDRGYVDSGRPAAFFMDFHTMTPEQQAPYHDPQDLNHIIVSFTLAPLDRRYNVDVTHNLRNPSPLLQYQVWGGPIYYELESKFANWHLMWLDQQKITDAYYHEWEMVYCYLKRKDMPQ